MKRFSLFFLLFAVVGCSDVPVENTGPLPDRQNKRFEELGKLFGDDAFVLGGNRSEVERTKGIGVNSFLWRASLDTISFMPLSSADPFGGVILTDWYSPQESPHERLKVSIFILGQVLRTDGIKVKIHKQVHDSKGEWKDVDVSLKTITDLENTILTRARQLRVSAGD